MKRAPYRFSGLWFESAQDQVQDIHLVRRRSLLYPPAVVIVGNIPSCEASVVCSLCVHHMLPNSNCHLHAQVLSSHGGRLLLFHGWALEGVIPVLASGIAATRMASAPRGSLIAASSRKASKTPTSLVHNVRHQLVPSKIQLLNQLLQSLAAVIVDIIGPATSNFYLPAGNRIRLVHTPFGTII